MDIIQLFFFLPLSTDSQLRYIPWSDSFTVCCFNFRPVIMPCFGPGAAYSRLWCALLPKSWSATEVGVNVFLATYFAVANVCKSAKWHAGSECRGGLVPITFHSLEISGSNLIPDTGYSRWVVSWLSLFPQANAYYAMQTPNNIPSPNLKVVLPSCISII